MPLLWWGRGIYMNQCSHSHFHSISALSRTCHVINSL
jgi:hypothetical protein